MHEACARLLVAAPMHASCMHVHNFNPYRGKTLTTAARRWNKLGASSSESHVYILCVLKNTESGSAPKKTLNLNSQKLKEPFPCKSLTILQDP